MSQADMLPMMLLAMEGLALGVGFVILGWMLAVHRRQRLAPPRETAGKLPFQHFPPRRPTCWIAVRATSPEAAKIALGLDHAAPCSWAEGLSGGHEFFISPAINGWVIITGMGLPDPTDDVDATFVFLTALSKQLGHVQYFYASRLLRHHAWARVDDGCVTRAYAWAGETVWNQGVETVPEIEIGLRMFGYGEHAATILDAETNFEKIPQLAARWSLDPASVKLNPLRAATGVAGESELC
jgi:hypothetical protein